jgi:hypothetical protein
MRRKEANPDLITTVSDINKTGRQMSKELEQLGSWTVKESE